MKKDKHEPEPKTLLVWRQASSDLVRDPKSEVNRMVMRRFSYGSDQSNDCPFCKILLIGGIEIVDNGDIYWSKCALCGWETTAENGHMYGISASWFRALVATEFDVNSPNVAFEELVTYLGRRYSDVYSLRWDVFERLVGDIFKAQGYRVHHTQLSQDGGADLILFGDDNKIIGIVECKKYAAHRSVGVGLVRSLVGTAVAWSTNRAMLVTSTQFTSGARKAAKQYCNLGFIVELIGTTELLKLLKVYNHELPLQNLSDKVRLEMIELNTRMIRERGLSFLNTSK